MDKKNAILSLVLSFVMIGAFLGQGLYDEVMAQSQLEGFENLEDFETYDGNIVKVVVGLLIGVVIATNLLPTVFNQTYALEQDDLGDLDTNEESLIGTWNIIIIAGIMLAIIGIVM